MKVKLSIIVPIYNVEKYLKECLDSIVYQNQDDIEVILVNDGSTDNSRVIAEEYVKKNKNFKLINKENGGLSSARNTGIEVAKGTYIMYIDSDDYLVKNAIKVIDSIINSYQIDLLYFSGKKLLCDDDCVSMEVRSFGSKFKYETDRGIDLYQKLRESKNYFTGVYYQVVKASVLSENNIKFINGILHEDHLYTYQVFSSAGKSIAIDNELYIYRIRQGSIMTTQINHYKRFVGFYKTFIEMLNWNENILSECNREIINLMQKHQDDMAIEAIKSYIKMDSYDLKSNSIQVKGFIEKINEYKTDNNKIKIFRKFYFIIRLVYINFNKLGII